MQSDGNYVIMSKLHTLAKIVVTLMRDPYALKRVLPDEYGTKHVSQHDEVYGNDYFQFVEQTTAQSADVIANSIVDAFHPSSIVDVGCGTGVLLERLRAQGIQVKGLEYALAALKFCWMRQLDVIRFDVATDMLPPEFGNEDVVVSMEVGQQLAEANADRYIDLLCRIARIVIFSSATPGQGDRRPINEQPHQYWIAKFRERGYLLDEALSLQWRDEWKAHKAAPWFWHNVMIFRC
jgi:SAM-dependent methyltransferase